MKNNDFRVMHKECSFYNTHMVLIVARVEKYTLTEFNMETRQVEYAEEFRDSEDMYSCIVPSHFDSKFPIRSYVSYEDIKDYLQLNKKIKEEK